MNPLSDIIRREIAQRGVLPFARFMELALYCPKHGYYEKKKDNPGRHGDFFTSVGVGEVFGQLLAFQFADWLQAEVLSPTSKVQIVEAGAHDGRLAGDILDWLQIHRPELFSQMEYWIIEASPIRQSWQRARLENFGARVHWLSRFDDSTTQRFNGVIFSNELLDAMPIHRFGWDVATKSWFAWGVAVEAEKYVWAKTPGFELPSFMRHLPPALLEVLPDGYIIETCPAAENWWRKAAGILERGKLMAIDYGLTAEELISPDRSRGTLRAYFRHHASDDVLANVGEQDLTAHVNFSAIQSAGESAGLKTEVFQTQAGFLSQILERAAKADIPGAWTSAQMRQFQTLTHPEHLGRAFRVLIQSR